MERRSRVRNFNNVLFVLGKEKKVQTALYTPNTNEFNYNPLIVRDDSISAEAAYLKITTDKMNAVLDKYGTNYSLGVVAIPSLCINYYTLLKSYTSVKQERGDEATIDDVILRFFENKVAKVDGRLLYKEEEISYYEDFIRTVDKFNNIYFIQSDRESVMRTFGSKPDVNGMLSDVPTRNSANIIIAVDAIYDSLSSVINLYDNSAFAA